MTRSRGRNARDRVPPERQPTVTDNFGEEKKKKGKNEKKENNKNQK